MCNIQEFVMITTSINTTWPSIPGDISASVEKNAVKVAADNKNNPVGVSLAEISSLASQLAASAAYSAEKNKGLSPAQLGDKARQLDSQIVGPGYFQWKVRNDQELPKATDPDSIARAKAATAFVNGDFKDNVGSEPNPFSGMSREQLVTIAYDESGTFTVNERRAAWHESYRQEEDWRKAAIARMNDEYNSTGKLTNFFKEVLEHYEGLPLMEQVQYPENYAADLKDKIKRDFNYFESIGIGGSMQDWVTAAKAFLPSVLEPSGTQPQT